MSGSAIDPPATFIANPIHTENELLAVESAAARSERIWWIGTIAVVALLFLSLQNAYWVPGGDSEVYVATARNLALGHGYLFNGMPARIAPPGWPILLALVMKFISPTFLVMKLLTLACMVAALAVYWQIIRRFTSPQLTSAIILLTAICSHVYSLTFWLHSDALFMLITALTLFISLQIADGKTQNWRIILMLALCVMGTIVRWAGLINVLIVCGALLHGQFKPMKTRAWIAAALVPIVAVASFMTIRWAMKHFAPPRVPAEASAIIDASAQLSDAQVEDSRDAQEPKLITGTGRGNTGYVTRFIGFGTWYSYLLWQPFRMAIGWDAVWWLATACGWLVLIIVIIGCIDEARERRWLLPAMLLYTLALDLNWPQATARYLVPLVPLIFLAIFRGVRLLSTIRWRELFQRKVIDPASQTRPPRWQRIAVRTLGIVGIASVALCNVTLFGIDFWVMRSNHFYDRYEAGLDKSLLAIGEYLNAKAIGNWQTCVDPEYININKRRMSPTGVRMLTMITGKATLQLPKKFTENEYKLPRDHDFREWIGRARVRYFLLQPTISPWRLWHFRVPWLQQWRTGEKPDSIDDSWQLYRCDGRSVPVLVKVPPLKHYPTRIAGL